LIQDFSFYIIFKNNQGGTMALNINEENFEKEIVKSDIPVLLDFWAPWCGPCKMLSPVVDELQKNTKEKSKYVR